MLNWLRRKINNWLVEESYYDDSMYDDSGELYASGFTISVYPATGGLVIKVKNDGDTVTLRSEAKLHVVARDQDLAESLAKIITLEALRK
jgi:hypothetical protein